MVNQGLMTVLKIIPNNQAKYHIKIIFIKIKIKYLKFCSLVFQKEIKISLRSFRCSEPMKKQLNVLQNSTYITSQAKTAKAEGLQHSKISSSWLPVPAGGRLCSVFGVGLSQKYYRPAKYLEVVNIRPPYFKFVCILCMMWVESKSKCTFSDGKIIIYLEWMHYTCRIKFIN